MNFAEGQNVKFARLFSPAVASADLATSQVIDTQGYSSLCILLQTGAVTAGAGSSEETLIEHSDKVNGGFVTVPDAELVGNKKANLAIAADDDDKLAAVDYVGIKRYVRVHMPASFRGGFAGVAILGHGRKRPETMPAFA